MAGLGTLDELRQRLGVFQTHISTGSIESEPPTPSPPTLPVPALPMAELPLNQTTIIATQQQQPRSPRKGPPQTGPQSRRKRGDIVTPVQSVGGSLVFGVCLGQRFGNLGEMVRMWRLGSPVATGLSKLVRAMEGLNNTEGECAVVYAQIPSEQETDQTVVDSVADVFIMEFGCFVVWGCSPVQLALLREALWPFLANGKREKKEDIHVDDLSFTSAKTRITINMEDENELLSYIAKDNIFIATEEMNEKLAYSYAFAQSVKLDVFERDVARSINTMDDIPTGYKNKTKKDHKRVSKKIGELIVLGCDVNLRSDVLEVPDILWEMNDVLPVYHFSRKYLDIAARLDVVNQRLTVMQEMYTAVQEQIHEDQSTRIEWIIIILIAVNILIELAIMAIEWATQLHH